MVGRKIWLLATFLILINFLAIAQENEEPLVEKEIAGKDVSAISVPISNEFGETQRYIITFSKKPVDFRDFVFSLGGRVTHDYTIIEGIAVEVPRAVAERLAELPNIKSIQLDELRFASLSESVPLINADDVWAEGFTGTDKNVCVVDTGVDYTHAALSGKVLKQKCYCSGNPGPKGCCPEGGEVEDAAMDDEGHGTHVAGIVASNDSTYKGVAYGANIYAVKVLDSKGSGWETDVIAGIDWCRNNGADIINLSLGGATKFASYCDSESDSVAVNNAVGAGLFVAVASGNDGWTDGISSPACASKATSVGNVYDADVGGIGWSNCTDSSTWADKIVCHCNRGAILDLLAPGALTMSAQLGGGFVEYGGTSMAAPHVAGAAALLLDANPNLTPKQIEALLKDTGKSIYDSGSNLTFPRADVLAAVTLPPMGHLEPYLIDPTTDKDVVKDEFFSFSSGVKCVGGACGDVNATLNLLYEIAYDDGTPDVFSDSAKYLGYGSSGGGFAVRFTPPFYPITIEKASFYVSDTIPFELHVWDDGGSGGSPGSDLITALQVNPDVSENWYAVDLSPYNIEIDSGDFYIGWIELSSTNYVGTDTSLPHDDRSWVYDGSSWDLLSSYGSPYDTIDMMIRAGKGAIPMDSGKPFYTTSANPQTCSSMQAEDTCTNTWDVNATGEIGSSYKFFTFYEPTTYAPYIDSNKTDKINITIVPPTGEFVSITLSGYPVDFGSLNPGTSDNNALGNAGNEYVISVDPTTNVNVDLYQKGTDFSGVDTIAIANMSTNTVNDSGSAANMGTSYNLFESNIAANTDVNAYYWLSIPAGKAAGEYSANISIKAVKTGEAP